jgi:hypothetical protein
MSLGVKLDEFYDRYLAPASVNSMSTERTLSKLRHLIGGMATVGEGKVNFRLYSHNDMASLVVCPVELKAARKEVAERASSKRGLQQAGVYSDPQGIVKLFNERLEMVTPWQLMRPIYLSFA